MATSAGRRALGGAPATDDVTAVRIPDDVPLALESIFEPEARIAATVSRGKVAYFEDERD